MPTSRLLCDAKPSASISRHLGQRLNAWSEIVPDTFPIRKERPNSNVMNRHYPLCCIALLAALPNAAPVYAFNDPVTADPNTGANFNRYYYANNNPYKFIDPDGREVKFAVGAPSDFLRNVARGIRYLNANGLADSVGQANMHKEVITVSPTQDRSDIYQNHYDPNTKTLYWADKAGLQITDTNTGDTGVRSPSLILGHEFEHVMNHLTSVNDYATDANTPDAQYNTREERNVIEEYENPAAEQLGEPTRSDHSSGKQVPAKCVETGC